MELLEKTCRGDTAVTCARSVGHGKPGQTDGGHGAGLTGIDGRPDVVGRGDVRFERNRMVEGTSAQPGGGAREYSRDLPRRQDKGRRQVYIWVNLDPDSAANRMRWEHDRESGIARRILFGLVRHAGRLPSLRPQVGPLGHHVLLGPDLSPPARCRTAQSFIPRAHLVGSCGGVGAPVEPTLFPDGMGWDGVAWHGPALGGLGSEPHGF